MIRMRMSRQYISMLHIAYGQESTLSYTVLQMETWKTLQGALIVLRGARLTKGGFFPWRKSTLLPLRFPPFLSMKTQWAIKRDLLAIWHKQEGSALINPVKKGVQRLLYLAV